MDLETAVTIAGGRITGPADLHDALPAPEIDLIGKWVRSIQRFIDAVCREAQRGSGAPRGPLSVVLTRSPSLALRTRRLDDGSVVLLLPVGAIVRPRLLATLLLTFPPRDTTISFPASIRDDRPETDWELPNRLLPIFGEFVDDDEHWELLGHLAAGMTPSTDADLNLALRDVTWAAMCYAVMHEVAHVTRGHLDAEHTFRERGPTPRPALSLRELRRGLEIDADANGSILFLVALMARLEEMEATQHFTSAFEWIGFAIPMFLGMYDTRRKALGLYAEGLYPHPVVRHELFVRVCANYLHAHKREWLDDWLHYEPDGWTSCIKALWRLDEDCVLGRFSDPPQEGWRCAPITAVNWHATDSPAIFSSLEQETALHQDVVVLLSAWQGEPEAR
ncbi:hypothetical protein ABZW18_34505 [Streptomyces sp. NPDC004647]|uniref:hypothetical protein n=1 Tax=Streptomyces sp. NPDC004647 TaxID=3154671 RepID=UPI0033BE29B8